MVVGSITSNGECADFRLMYRQLSGGAAQGFFQLKSSDPSLNAALIAAELPARDL